MAEERMDIDQSSDEEIEIKAMKVEEKAMKGKKEMKEEKEMKGIQFIEPDAKKKMTTAKRKRVEKAKQKINLKQRRQELFEELSKIMLTEDELPNFKSTTKLGVDMDAENQETVIVMPKRVKPKEAKKKVVEETKEEEKVTKIVVSDGKKTFGFGFVNDNLEIVEAKKEEKKEEMGKVLFINQDNDETESSDSNDSINNDEMSEESINDSTEEDLKEELKEEEVSQKEEGMKEEVNVNQAKMKHKQRIIPIEIRRTKEMKEKRNKLPIMMEETNIIEAVIENESVVICGETGSGKTTQIPQILYEIGFGNEKSEFQGMIGITQPRRIAAVAMANRVKEEMGEDGNVVSHQIRYDKTVTKQTRIKFMTDGILLREAQSDVMLKEYSCIIIDEAHERSLNTDVLIGILSRIVKLRNKEGRPMRIIIMSATLRVSEFIDNQQLFRVPPKMIKVESRQYPVRTYFSKKTEIDNYCDEAIKKITKIHNKLPPGGILVFLTGHREIEDVCSKLRQSPQNKMLHVLSLYSSLDPDEQQKVFNEVPEGYRLCVVSTNVAETSITIPNIKYVVDAGRAKQRIYDVKSGVSSFVINWISKASAEQRAGRAGRVGEGYCYRLYSSAVYNDIFVDFTSPEIERMPLESVILSLKAMGIDKVINFPFPSKISVEGLKRANRLLQVIGLLDAKENITPIGLEVKEFPLHPRLGKLLYLSKQHNLLEIGLSLVSSLSISDIFIDSDVKYDRSLFMNKDSDLISLVLLVDTFRLVHSKNNISVADYCSQYGVKLNAFNEILLLRSQLCSILKIDDVPPSKLISPSDQITIRKIIAYSFVDNTARLVRREELGKFINSGLRHAYISTLLNEPVIISNTSFLHGQLPDYVVFNEIIEFNYKSMRGLTRVNFKWLEDASFDFITSFEKKSFN